MENELMIGSVGVSVAVMVINAVELDVVNVLTYGVQGFMVGATAVGLNELMEHS